MSGSVKKITPRERPLSRQQLRVLHNLALGHPASVHVHGMSMWGGFGQTIDSLFRRELLTVLGRSSGALSEKLTLDGIKAHRTYCCKQGRTEEDELVDRVEDKLIGISPVPIRVEHSKLAKITEGSLRVTCPVCRHGILLLRRDGRDMRISRHDYCTECRQQFIYTDVMIGGERLADE